jgi:hypothetical protein
VNDPFTPPPEPSGIKAGDLLGRLLLIRPLDYDPAVPTAYGTAPAVRCRIADLDGPTVNVHDDVLLFGRNLVGQLRAALTSGTTLVLGRMGQGEAKPDKSPPWLLLTPSEADKAAARAYLASARPPTPPAAATPQASPFQAPSPGARDDHPF